VLKGLELSGIEWSNSFHLYCEHLASFEPILLHLE